MKKTYDNIAVFDSRDKPESETDRERRAELTLLSHVIDMPEDKRADFLAEIGCSEAEYARLTEKWARVLTRYQKEKETK